MLERIREARENESGFTLIELLIVIIILGILATIVLFATGTFSSDSKTAACKANARILTTAEAAYAAAHNGTVSNHSAAQLSGYLDDPFPVSPELPTPPAGTSTHWTTGNC